jgi:hypothetical protein
MVTKDIRWNLDRRLSTPAKIGNQSGHLSFGVGRYEVPRGGRTALGLNVEGVKKKETRGAWRREETKVENLWQDRDKKFEVESSAPNFLRRPAGPSGAYL